MQVEDVILFNFLVTVIIVNKTMHNTAWTITVMMLHTLACARFTKSVQVEDVILVHFLVTVIIVNKTMHKHRIHYYCDGALYQMYLHDLSMST